MRDFVFSDPSDGLGRNADFGLIETLLRTRGEEYWNNPDGSGFADLSYFPEGNGNEDGPGCVARLTFTKLDRLGFHFYYCYEVCELDSPYYREAEYYKSHAGGPLASRSPVNDSCEGKRFIFDALFVPVDAAVAVVRHFLTDGGRSPGIEWLDSEEVVRAERAIGS